MRRLTRPAVFALAIVFAVSGQIRAQAVAQCEDADHHIVYEFGWAGDWSRDEGLKPRGATFAFEIPAIDRWLELEFGVEAIHADNTEVSAGVLFKKPWRFSPKFEFMAGAGPALIQERGVDGGPFWGVSSVLDFMVWPRRNLGWYVEPGYEVAFRDGQAHRGLGITAGLLVGR